MYNYGEDFDYNSDITKLIMDYVNMLKNKKASVKTIDYMENTYLNNKKDEKTVCDEAKNGWIPIAEDCWQVKLENDVDKVVKHFSPAQQKFYKCVCMAVDEEDYDGSPIYSSDVDDELLDNMLNRAVELSDMDNENNINIQQRLNSQNDFKKDFIEMLLYWELFGNRRHRRHTPKKRRSN